MAVKYVNIPCIVSVQCEYVLETPDTDARDPVQLSARGRSSSSPQRLPSMFEHVEAASDFLWSAKDDGSTLRQATKLMNVIHKNSIDVNKDNSRFGIKFFICITSILLLH